MLTDAEISRITNSILTHSMPAGEMVGSILKLLATVKALRKESTEQRELLRKALPYVKQDLSSWDAELINQIEEALK